MKHQRDSWSGLQDTIPDNLRVSHSSCKHSPPPPPPRPANPVHLKKNVKCPAQRAIFVNKCPAPRSYYKWSNARPPSPSDQYTKTLVAIFEETAVSAQ